MPVRLRFTIRDLLWMVCLAAVCVAWWIDRSQICNRSHVTYPRFGEMIVHHPSGQEDRHLVVNKTTMLMNSIKSTP